jgi:alanine racemase
MLESAGKQQRRQIKSADLARTPMAKDISRRDFGRALGVAGVAGISPVAATFLATGAASQAGWQTSPETRGDASPSARDSSFDPWIEIHAGNLRHNVTEVRRRAGSRPIIGVIKNNGYGIGTALVGRLLDPLAEIEALAVVKLHEAVVLRDAGVRKPVLLMGPCDERDLEEVVARDIQPMVYTPIGDLMDRIAAKLQRPTALHVCVDTGIGRVGVPYREAGILIRDLAARRSVRIAGTMMTFSEDPDFDVVQLKRFTALCADLERDAIGLGRKHAASSFGLFTRPDGFLDAVRPGMAIYGVYSEAEFRKLGVMNLQPAISLKARVAYVKQLRSGDSAGYNRAYLATRDVWVATLPVGHADGWPRAAAKGARVAINGALYPVVASVSASHSIVEIGEAPRVAIGDVATFFDWTEGSRPEDVSSSCGASVYDLTMHLNPLLPRRVI